MPDLFRQTIFDRVFRRRISRRGIPAFSQPTAPMRAIAMSSPENPGAPSRAATPFPPRRSRPRLRRDTFSACASAVYRPHLEMQTSAPLIRVSVRDQRLDLVAGDDVLASYPVSTSRYGLGSEEGSMKTPLGRFAVAEKIGAGLPSGTVF